MPEQVTDFNPAADIAATLISLLPPEQLAGQDPEELREILAGTMAPVTDALKPWSLRGDAVRLQRQAAELLDEADSIEFRATLRKAVTEAEALVTTAVAHADRLVDAERVAVERERAEADRLAEAREVARLAQERVEDLALTKAPAADQVEARLRMNAADEVAGRINLETERAAAARVTVEAELAAAREAVRQARLVAQQVKGGAANPPDAPYSAFTAALDGLRRMAFGEKLDKGAEGVVAVFVELLMGRLDLDRVYVNRGRVAEQEDRKQQEAEEKRREEERQRQALRAGRDVTGRSTNIAPPGVRVGR